MKEIKTVGEMRKALRHSDAGEPLVFDLEEDVLFGKRKKSKLKCVGVGSSGGGRITVLWFDRTDREELEYTI